MGFPPKEEKHSEKESYFDLTPEDHQPSFLYSLPVHH